LTAKTTFSCPVPTYLVAAPRPPAANTDISRLDELFEKQHVFFG
jgi:hypothetical protein